MLNEGSAKFMFVVQCSQLIAYSAAGRGGLGVRLVQSFNCVT